MFFLTKLIFYFKKPYLIIVADQSDLTCEVLLHILGSHFRVEKIKKITLKNVSKNNALVFPFDSQENLGFFVQNSKKPILVVNQTDEVSSKEIKKLSKNLLAKGSLLLNFDNQEIRGLDDKGLSSVITFGLLKDADLSVSDFLINEDEQFTNFKIDYDGNIVPVWLNGTLKKNEIYSILAAICCGLELDLNLVEISQSLKNFQKNV